MWSNLLNISDSLSRFFEQLKDAIQFEGFLGIALGVEVLFILLFAIKSVFSYEARLKRILDKCNAWLFSHKKIDSTNIKEFNNLVKKGPKRFSYYWQQFILNRDGGPTAYMTEDNLIEKPLRTSSWQNNVKNLQLLTIIWSVVSLLMGIASFSGTILSVQTFAVALVLPAAVLLIGAVAILFIKGKRALNLDDIYHLYHIYARFVTNACDELPPYIDFDLLFTPKEIEKGNAQIREYYEEKARQAKEEFEQAQKAEENQMDYNFRDVGVDGALLLERAMKESEIYITTKNNTLAQIAKFEAEREALKRNYETVQMDLQRKLQASKENIQSLIEQQSTTTNRFEVGRLRDRQDKEIKKQEELQKDYDKEERNFLKSDAEIEEQIKALSDTMVKSLDQAEKGMTAEYQSFFKKVMKSAYAVAEGKVATEKKGLEDDKNEIEQELISVQTQIKRLLDENITLRAKIEELSNQLQQKSEELAVEQEKNAATPNNGNYDENGNFVYSDGSYHDTKGFFHDVDGRVYDMNGRLIIENENITEEEINAEKIKNDMVDSFGPLAVEENKEEIPSEIEEEIQENLEQANYDDTDYNNYTEELTEQPYAFETENQTEDVTENVEETEEKQEPEEPTENIENVTENEELPENTEENTGTLFDEDEINDTVESFDDFEDVQSMEVQEEPVEEEPKFEEEQVGEEPKPESEEEVEEPAQENKPKSPRGRKPRSSSTSKKPTQRKKRAKPRKLVKKDEDEVVDGEEEQPAEPKKRGRPRKNPLPNNEDEINNLNNLISEEEAKLENMRNQLSQDIDQAIDDNVDFEREKNELVEAVESLKQQADAIKNGDNNEDLAAVNKRLEDLINEIANLNNNSDETPDEN